MSKRIMASGALSGRCPPVPPETEPVRASCNMPAVETGLAAHVRLAAEQEDDGLRRRRHVGQRQAREADPQARSDLHQRIHTTVPALMPSPRRG